MKTMDRRIGIVLLLFPVLFVASILPSLVLLLVIWVVAAFIHMERVAASLVDGTNSIVLLYALAAIISALICAYIWPRDTVEERRWNARPGIS